MSRRRTESSGLALGCGALALLACLSVVYATPSDAYWIVDCGNKALVAERLWESGYRDLAFTQPAAHLDPEGEFFPIPPPFAWRRGADFVSQYPPTYPALAAPFGAALGPAGLRWPAALGTAACAALFAAWTAPLLGRRRAAAGALALALATPLFFYGAVVWEHSLTVALPLASVWLLRCASPGRAAAAGALAALACALRAELVLLALALVLGLRTRRAASLLALAAGALPVGAAWLGTNALAYGDPLGVHVAPNLGVDAALATAGAGEALRRAVGLLAGFGQSPLEAAALAAAALASLAAVALPLPSPRRRDAALVGLAAVGAAACLLGSLRVATAAIPLLTLMDYNGLLVRAPWLALAGLGAARIFREVRFEPLRLGVGAGLLFLLLAVPLRATLTQFESSGFWGPRMLLPGLPALLACAWVALEGAGPRVARLAAAGLFGAGLVSSAVSVQLLHAQKLETRRLQQTVLEAPKPVVVTNHPALGQQLAGIWGARPFLYAAGAEDLARLAPRLRSRGVDAFLLLHRARGGRAPHVAAGCRLRSRYRGQHVAALFDLDLYACQPRG